MAEESIKPGVRVYLRTCSGIGEPGTVIRHERSKLVVHWQDLQMETRHRPEALELAKENRCSLSA
jgi:hypothetical protein